VRATGLDALEGALFDLLVEGVLVLIERIEIGLAEQPLQVRPMG